MRRDLTRFALLLSLITFSIVLPAQQNGAPEGKDKGAAATAWAEFGKNMRQMHAAMGSIQPSGDNDIDFARLMLAHHRAALDMAKTELLYGKDPQMRRLAQEIVTDQQSEIDLMSLWLKQHEARDQK